jgi:hypothetical protein
MLAPIDPTIKERIISAYLSGHGRNRIARDLYGQGIKISHGSITNIISAYKRKHQQQSPSSQLQQLSQPKETYVADVRRRFEISNCNDGLGILASTYLAIYRLDASISFQ